MKLNLSNYLSICSLVILFGYITYKEWSTKPSRDKISDEGVFEVQYEGEISDQRLPAVSFDVPATMSFAGETVPLDVPDVHERLDKELQINCYLHSNTIFLDQKSQQMVPRDGKNSKKI